MSKKVQAMLYVTIMVISLSVVAVLYILMPECEYCHKKFCFGSCVIDYRNINNTSKKKPTMYKTNQSTTRLAENNDATDDYLDNIYFIGDSRTVALKLYDIDETHIFAEDGINHETALTKEFVKLSENKITTLEEAVKATVPEIMIVNFGINGVKWMDVNTFMDGYEKLIDQLILASPNSIIIIESILPVSLGYEQQETGCSNEKIDLVNDALYQLAKDKGLYYLGTNEVLKNENNDLIDSYHNGDGLHYNKHAYEKILDYIKSHAIIKK